MDERWREGRRGGEERGEERTREVERGKERRRDEERGEEEERRKERKERRREGRRREGGEERLQSDRQLASFSMSSETEVIPVYDGEEVLGMGRMGVILLPLTGHPNLGHRAPLFPPLLQTHTC